MATIMEMLVLGAALTAAVWAIFATIKPELARIADLLKHGPVATPAPVRNVAVRTIIRDVRVLPVRSQPPLRAAA